MLAKILSFRSGSIWF